jgi:hypothetical protein
MSDHDLTVLFAYYGNSELFAMYQALVVDADRDSYRRVRSERTRQERARLSSWT